MSKPRSKKPLKYFISTILLMGLLAYYQGDIPEPVASILGQAVQNETVSTNTASNEVVATAKDAARLSKVNIVISDRASTHILYGDRSGGGHKFGTGKPCKSEFPEDWNDKKILDTIQNIASNDNVKWKQQDNGYHVTEKYVEDLKVRVVVGRQKKNVITAYPTNVKRNPCPYQKPSNDNHNR